MQCGSQDVQTSPPLRSHVRQQQPPQCCRIADLGLTAMKRRRDGVLAAACAAIVVIGCGCRCATAQEQPKAVPPCGGDAIAQGVAGRITDGRTFVLNDGREVRLAAIEVPPLTHGSDAAPGGRAAKDTLDALAGGDEVLLRRAEISTDRYGRLSAYAYTLRDDAEIFVQGEMIAAGFARVGDHVGSRDCAAELLSREKAARKAKLGLWVDPYYDPLRADHPAAVLAQRGRFALVEGKVVSVHASGATIYLNFGQQWSEDFTVTILKRNERNFAAAGLDPQSLTGRRVRVRGWIEGRGSAGNSPWIEAAYPEQIEFSDRD
jgi:endonuclease YncB( thermonuclease family)